MLAHVLQPLHPDGGRDDQRPRVGVEVIQNHWESDWRAVGSHAGELTCYRFLNGMIHPIRQLFHTFPTFLSSASPVCSLLVIPLDLDASTMRQHELACNGQP